jgi:hypothetical protein
MLKMLKDFNLIVSEDFVRSFLSQRDLTLKIISPIGHHKFTYENVLYYGDFIVWIQLQDMMRLKFLDESHFGPDRMTDSFLLFFIYPSFLLFILLFFRLCIERFFVSM